MKTTVKIAPKTEYTEFIDRDLYRIEYKPISVFLSVIKEVIGYIQKLFLCLIWICMTHT